MGSIIFCFNRNKDQNMFLNCSSKQKKTSNDDEPEITIKTINKIYGKDYIKNCNIK